MENIRELLDKNLKKLSTDLSDLLTKTIREKVGQLGGGQDLFSNVVVLTTFRKSENQLLMLITLSPAKSTQKLQYDSFLGFIFLDELNTLTKEPTA
jgi:hypothetical protein